MRRFNIFESITIINKTEIACVSIASWSIKVLKTLIKINRKIKASQMLEMMNPKTSKITALNTIKIVVPMISRFFSYFTTSTPRVFLPTTKIDRVTILRKNSRAKSQWEERTGFMPKRALAICLMVFRGARKARASLFMILPTISTAAGMR